MVSTLVGGLCGLIGVYIVLRRMAYIGHGLSHAIFGGAVVSYLMSINFLVGASVWGFVSALLINLTTRQRRIGADAAIGIVTTASFALGVALISRFKTFTRSFDAALFGNILGVSDSDVIAVTVVALAAAAAVFVGYKHLLFATFEPEVSRFYGVPSGWVDAGFSIVLASVIVVSLQVLGVTMLAAAIVIPPVVARLLTNDFNRMLVGSVVVGRLLRTRRSLRQLLRRRFIRPRRGTILRSPVRLGAGILLAAPALGHGKEPLGPELAAPGLGRSGHLGDANCLQPC